MGFTFGSPGHDARSVTVHIEKLSILGDPAAREVGGMEAWIEVEMPGLDHLLTTPRVQATAGDFVFACVLEAHIGLAAEAKLREALASRDEEDADVTFKLRALGPRKKAKEVASGYFNLHQTLKHGQDLSGQIQLDGRDDEPFGSLAVSLTVLEVLRLCQPSTDPSESPEVVADTTGDALEAAPNSSTMPLCDPRPAPSTLEAAPCANAGFATPGKDHIASKEGGAGVDISESEIIARARRLGINLDVAGVAATEPAVGFVGPAVAAAAAAPLNTTLSPAGGYTCDPESTAQLDEATEALLREMLSERREAQRARDYARADLLREKIRDLGVRVQDRTETYFVELCKSAGDGGETPSSSSHGYVRGDAGAVSFSEEEQLTIDRLLLERVRARQRRAFVDADRLRDELGALGVSIDDSARTFTVGTVGGGSMRADGRLGWSIHTPMPPVRVRAPPAKEETTSRHGYIREEAESIDETELDAAAQRALDGLLETRRVAQRSRDYGFADQLRDELAKIGVVVNDRMRSYSLEMASEAGEMLSWLERRWASGRPRE